MALTSPAGGLGNRIAPPRFIVFALLLALGIPIGANLLGWREGVMLGFDAAAIVFLLICLPLLGHEAEAMREAARRNDANRAVLLAITVAVTLVVLVAIAAELAQKTARDPLRIAIVIATLTLTWLFSNVIYALHYAHLFYTGRDGGGDRGGIEIPGEPEPDYWDFLYFSFTLGMTFQTSDSNICSRDVRRVATFHSFAAFVFDIGVVALTVNVLGGG